jgi:predicted metal-dependent HD superfamily phosphohydrolase
MRDTGLRERFSGLWRRLGAADDGHQDFDRLLAAYREPHRVYHGLDHLRDCLVQLDAAPAAAADRDLAEAALWFHDAVYVPGSSDNEARSAELATRALDQAGTSKERAREVARLIRLTDHMRPAKDAVAALVCDVDLSILGRPAADYDEYERRVRAEYGGIAEPLYRAGRRAILARFLARQPLYRSDHFRALYESAARRNLRQSLETLAGGRGTE